ncbi:MAG: Multimeric flavodoxin WrbA, partial [Candidatus Methanocomedens sp.]
LSKLYRFGIIIGIPVYQGNLSAQTKTMLDRCRAVVAKDPDLNTT